MTKESPRSVVLQRIGGSVLRTTNPQPSLWEAILPAGILGLPAELARVDALLDDPGFLAPFAAHYDPVLGRPSVPIDTYLRMMFLKFRYRLGYELVCREVADSISWQRFCRIPLGGQVPHATTLVKLTRRVGPPLSTSSTRRCWPTRPPTRSCAPTRFAPTPRSWPPTSATRPTLGCSLARSPRWPAPSSACTPLAAPGAPTPVTGAAPPSSPGRCAPAPARPSSWSPSAPPSRPHSPSRPRRRRRGRPQHPPRTGPRRRAGLREADAAGRRPGDHHRAHQPGDQPSPHPPGRRDPFRRDPAGEPAR